VGLNRLCGDVLSLETLKEISAKLGADIPFVIDGGTQRLSGIGTEMVERFDSPKLPIVIVKPQFGISTPAAYRLLDSIHDNFEGHVPMDSTRLLENLRYLKSTANDFPMYNRFEEVLDTLCPESLAILHYLKSNGCNALLSGSGAAVFGIAESAAESNRIANSIKKEFPDYFVYVTETANSGCTFIN
jgi:4-diphosphocytidyl-2-C-methyl-D-erythritol kinase